MRHENMCCLIVDKQTFSQVVADINNVQVISVPLTEEFHLPVDEVYIYICSLVLTSVYMIVIRNSHFSLSGWKSGKLFIWNILLLLFSVHFSFSKFWFHFYYYLWLFPYKWMNDTITGWVLLVEKFQRKKINPFILMSDQNTISFLKVSIQYQADKWFE